ncbi:hypothetical protein CF319_g821 [Tilletia indica]|nr:hypothetical protein CF319_g821 [Tilletia indica]
MDTETAHVNGIAPAKFLAVDETEEVLGSGKDPYKLKRHLDHYSCTCPAWRFQSKASIVARTCKHLKTLLGEAYESARVTAAGGMAPTSPSSSPKKRAASGSSSASPTKKSKNEVKVNLMLAETYMMDGKVDPTGWWMSEKLDGVRAYWDGSSMWSRASNCYEAPESFKAKLPNDMNLDGELWMQRDAFDETSGLIRSGAASWKKWDRIIYMVFDIVGDTNPFEQRLETLKQRFGEPQTPSDALSQQKGGGIVVLKQEKCTSREHLLEELKKVEAVGGEGLMLRKAGSQYEHKRSRTLLKVKTFYDAEAVVIAIEEGDGKNKGRMGALRCRMENGSTFKVGTGFKDSHRNHPPEVGTVITYKFQELSHEGTPRFPVFVGIAADKTVPKDAIVRSTLLRTEKKAAAALAAAEEEEATTSSAATTAAKRTKK